ncbi:MAG: hypothetical protein NC308_03380 [Clostridium sp.]|nr:hypothetical protein [Bacteroides sp.]MCM1197908.1 hypothetical protein [Clostridium sp.]
MNKIPYILFLVLSVLALMPAMSYGQNIPSLPQDPNIVKGTLPDGISYYLVTNKTEKGLVDFALVQKRVPADTLDDAVDCVRTSLGQIPRFGRWGARDFIVRNGFLKSRNTPADRSGLVNVREDAAVYRFGTMPAAKGETAIDSTLLMIFGIIEKTGGYGSGMMPTSANAIIVSGDIDKDAMLKKMHMLSLMLPRSMDCPQDEETYRWQPSDTASCIVVEDTDARFSTVKVVYSSPRTPKNMMGTVLPLVSERLGDIVGTILKKRIYTEMKRNGVPLAFVGYRYYKSAEQSGDEKYEISIHTDREHTGQAVRIMAGVLSDIDSKGVLPKEFVDARGEYLMELYGQSLAPVTPNRMYVDLCISSFLYGTDLSRKDDRFRFFVKGKVADSTQTRMFNRFASELVDMAANMTLSVRSDSLEFGPAELLEIFNEGWQESSSEDRYISYAVNQSDSVAMDNAAAKVKAKITRKEPVSGGTLWQFDNGVNVVYKRMSTGGLFYYTMVIRGGYSAMPDIKRGEGAFLSDMLETYNICGLKPEDFNSILLSNGITMSSKVGLSDMRIYGMAPRPSLTLLMKSLAAVANERSIVPKNFDYYRACETLRLESRKNSVADRIAAIDSLMCPAYNYSSDKTAGALYPDLQERAMKFFDDQFSRVNDGVIVIVGDMEENAMKKFLQGQLGAFRTQDHGAVRVKLPYQPISGWTTYMVDGKKSSVDVAMSSPMPYSAENYMLAKVTALAVQDALNRALCGTGTSLRVSSDLVMYPQERFSMLVSVENIPLDRLPAGEAYESAVHILYRIRETLSELSSTPLPQDRLNIYRTMVSNEISSSQNDPAYWLSVVTARYAEGKDLNTKYSDKINAVTAEKVKETINSLNTGSKVEYVINQWENNTRQ